MIAIAVSLLGGICVAALANELWPPLRYPPARPTTPIAPGPTAPARSRGGASSSDLIRMWMVVLLPVGMGGWLAGHGATVRAEVTDLEITGHDQDTVLAGKILAAAAAGLLGAIVVLALRAVGLAVPVLILAATLIALMGAAYLLPDVLVRRQARRRREEFTQALPVWCDLVALEMAGTAAPQEALVTAAEAGTTWPMLVLRDTLHRAVRSRRSHWEALTELGERTGIRDLTELGRLSQLVSHEGAQVRDTLLERAASIRRRALAESLGQAGQRDESMRLAVLVIAAGIVLLMLFPGAIAVMNL